MIEIWSLMIDHGFGCTDMISQQTSLWLLCGPDKHVRWSSWANTIKWRTHRVPREPTFCSSRWAGRDERQAQVTGNTGEKNHDYSSKWKYKCINSYSRRSHGFRLNNAIASKFKFPIALILFHLSLNLVNLVVHFSSLELKGLTFNPLDFAIWYWFSCIISIIQSVWKRLQHLLHLGFKFCFYFAFSAANFENQIETSRCKSELHQGEANKLCSHLGSNFELIRGSPPPPLLPNTSGQFSQPHIARHWVSLELKLKVAYMFRKIGAPGVHIVPAIKMKKKNFCHLCPSWEHKKQTETERRFPHGAALDEPRVAKWTSLLGTARTDEK